MSNTTHAHNAIADFKPGDVIRYPSGRLDYLLELPGMPGLWTNACNHSWIERGLRSFGQECYPFTDADAEDVEVVGHQGDGGIRAAEKWYEAHKAEYSGESD